MGIPSRAVWRVAAVAAALAGAASAQAQWEDPEQGEWQPPPPDQPPASQPDSDPPGSEEQPPPSAQPESQPPASSGPQQPQPPASGSGGEQPQQAGEWFRQRGERPPAFEQGEPATEAPSDAPSDTDHGAVVGAVGVGFFGLETLSLDPGVPPLADGTDPDIAPGDTRVRAPTIGIRYWLSETVGIDAAVGFGFTDHETTNEEDKIIGGSDGFGLVLHAGVPLALSVMPHFNVQLIPEVDVGFGSGTLLARMAENDVSLSTFMFRLGARLGGEIQFGFWDLPQLALQATIGLGFEHSRQTAEVGDVEVTNSGIRLSSTVQDLFNGTIRAIYYFR